MLQAMQLSPSFSRSEGFTSTSYGALTLGHRSYELLDVSAVLLHPVGSRRCRMETLGCNCSRPRDTSSMVFACCASSFSIQMSCSCSPHSLSFRHNVLRQLAVKRGAEGRCALVIVRGQRKAEGLSVADENSGEEFEEMTRARRDTGSEKEHLTSVASQPPQTGRGVPMNLAAGVGVTAAVVIMAVLGFLAKPREDGGGSVSDLVKRGQLRSDRGDGRTLKYEDPFNNPLVKVGKKNPIVRMCGKLFRLAPVTLTDEKRVSHQNRRVQAYRWKRPVLFLSEGEPVPEGVDPEEVRWIPSNHPFATTNNYIDEGLAQQNVMQTRGVPSRVKAEHEALRKKMMEAASKEPEFKFPDSSTDQWSTTPSFNEDDRENVGEDEGRLQTDKRRPAPGNNGSSRLRSIDGSGYSDKSHPFLHEGRSESQ